MPSPAGGMIRALPVLARFGLLLGLLLGPPAFAQSEAPSPEVSPPEPISPPADRMRVHVEAGDSLELSVHIDHPRLLPGFVVERLRRGIPVTVGFQMELWRDRSVWFDNNLATRVSQFKVTRDAWTGAFSLATADTAVVVDSLRQVVAYLSDVTLPFPLEERWAESDSRHRMAVTAVVIPLSAQDLGEVEDWLTGELGGGGGGLLAIPRGLFNIVRDLSGLGDRKAKAQSERFYLRRRGPGVAVVTLPSENGG